MGPNKLGLAVGAEPGGVRAVLSRLTDEPTADPLDLAADVLTKASAKFDHLLPEALLVAECASRIFDVEAAHRSLIAALDRERMAPLVG